MGVLVYIVVFERWGSCPRASSIVRCAGVLVYRRIGVLVYRCIGLPVYRCLAYQCIGERVYLVYAFGLNDGLRGQV